jgi:hypothetical protein
LALDQQIQDLRAFDMINADEQQAPPALTTLYAQLIAPLGAGGLVLLLAGAVLARRTGQRRAERPGG